MNLLAHSTEFGGFVREMNLLAHKGLSSLGSCVK